MTAPAAELQKAIHGALADDAAVGALIGDRIFDHVPATAPFPYVSFGATSIYDWSTATESGAEQLFTLHVWSKGRGRKEALAIMEVARACLEGANLALDGHSLVNLAPVFSEVRFDDEQSVHHGLLRYRAVTEPTG